MMDLIGVLVVLFWHQSCFKNGGGRIHIHIVSRVLNYHQMALNLTQQSLNCSGDAHFAEK